MSQELIFLHAKKTSRCTAVVDKHFEGYCSLQFIRRGAVEIFYDQARHIIRAPAFWTCYPGPHIRFHGFKGESWHHSYMAMRGPGLVELRQRGLFFFGVQSCPVRKAGKCAMLMDRVIRLIHSPEPLSSQRAANLLESLLLDLAEWHHSQQEVQPWLKTLLSQLESPDRAGQDYSSLAKSLGMGLSTMRRLFRKNTGTSLHRYVLDLKMSKARYLVGNRDLPFKDIADQLGYDNLFFFSRQFSRFHGVSPSIYRRSRQS